MRTPCCNKKVRDREAIIEYSVSYYYRKCPQCGIVWEFCFTPKGIVEEGESRPAKGGKKQFTITTEDCTKRYYWNMGKRKKGKDGEQEDGQE